MSFEYNVVTSDGANLIAQATATNPIVFIGCLSSATAASSKEDLASKTRAFYTGKSGGIYAASAQNNVARIMMSFDNVGLQSPQLIKAACVLGRLYNQTDADAVIVAALSDTDSQIYIPDSSSPKVMLNIPINIKISTDDDIATVGAEYASLGDLERLVSAHKAGNPYEGENQDVYGEKVFKEAITTNGIKSSVVSPYSWISVEEQLFADPNTLKKAGTITLNANEEGFNKSAYISLNTGYDAFGDATSSVYIESESITARADAELMIVSKEYARLVSSSDLSDPFNNPPYAMVATRYNSSGNNASVLLRVKRATTDEYGVNYSIYTGGRPSLFPVQANTDLGVSDNKWDNVYANTFKGNLDGLIPTTGYSQTPTIGSIFLAHLEARASIGNKGIGEAVTNDDYAIRKAMLSLANGVVSVGFESAIVDITTGSYKLLSAIDGLSANEATVALVMRVS